MYRSELKPYPQTNTTNTTSDEKAYVYILVNPFIMKVFYVGIATNPIERFITHLKKCDDNTNEDKNAVIQDIIKKGAIPFMYVVRDCSSKQDALEKEAFTIEAFRALDHPITNHSLRLGYTYSEIETTLLQSIIDGKGKRIPWYVRILGKIFLGSPIPKFTSWQWAPPRPRHIRNSPKHWSIGLIRKAIDA